MQRLKSGAVKKLLKNPTVKKWLFSIVLIFVSSLVGWVVSVFIGSYIPFWLLLGFSIIYCFEKWLGFYTWKYQTVLKIYKLTLNLSILFLFGLLAWSGKLLFTKQFMRSALIGSVVFIGELVVFIWLLRVFAINRPRQPSMKLTLFSLAFLFVIFAFAGVHPFSDYKDEVAVKVADFISTRREEARRRSTEATAKEMDRELKVGFEVLEAVNAIRKQRGSSELQWDSKLYEYSLNHAKNMAAQGTMFHSDVNLPYAENTWGGGSSWRAKDIVESWMNSKMHRTWLLCPNLEHIAVGVAYSNNGMYVAWTFWKSETLQSDWWYQYTPDNPPKWLY